MVNIRGSIKYIDEKSFIVRCQQTEGLEQYLDKDCHFDIRQHHERRSLSANAYFHVLADRIRTHPDVLRSLAWVKNWLIASYGQQEYIAEGEPLFYKTNAPPEYVAELETPHLVLSKTVPPEAQGKKESYIYRVYRGSHTYNTAEMWRLIEGTVQEAKALGIQTETPESIRQMMERWGEEIERSKKRKETKEHPDKV